MEMLHLKFFVAVAECGSFSAAATLHKVAQPKISRYVRALEDEVGAPLFYRNGRGADLTEAGRFLLAHSYDILEKTNRIRAGIQSISGNPGGEVIVGLPSTISSIVTLELLDWVRSKHPRVELTIRESASDHIKEWLSTGQIDVAVLVDTPKTSTLLLQRIGEEKLFIVSRESDEAGLEHQSVADLLRGQTVLIPGTARSIERYREDERFAGARLLPLDCLAAAVDFIRQGRGFAILPASYTRRMIEARFAGRMSIRETPFTRILSLATTTQRAFSPAAHLVADEIVNVVRRIIATTELSPATGMSPRRPSWNERSRTPNQRKADYLEASTELRSVCRVDCRSQAGWKRRSVSVRSTSS